MYPLPEGLVYQRNQWYVAAWNDEVSREILERRILGDVVAFYRTETGEPVAISGLCPHRLYPLSKGRLVGDNIRCGYHGFTFDSKGGCVAIPSQDTVPSRFRLRTYPLVQRWEWLWIWMGDPAEADETKIPDHDALGLGAPGWRADRFPGLHLPARYTLLIDNLLDLTHIGFIHETTVGGAVPNVSESKMRDEGGRISVEHHIGGLDKSPFENFLFPTYQGRVDKLYRSEYESPAIVNAAIDWFAWQEGVRGEALGTINFLHGITPETPHSTHYFVTNARNFRLEDNRLSAALERQNMDVVRQDLEALGIVESYADRYGDAERELSAIADAGAIRVRRRLAEQIKAEAGTAS
jgi:phenylpropionate dioxygenase-like ring-hydroxylating dioxygenase large terminal subunit